MAQLIARDLGAYDEWSYMERDGKGTTSRTVPNIERWLYMCPPGGQWKILVINEAQDMADGAAQAFLTLLDGTRLPAKRLVIFTSTADLQGALFGNEDQVCRPLRGRVKTICLTSQGLSKVFAQRAREIAQAENLDGKPESAYQRLMQDCRNSMREALQRIDNMEMLL
jgi:DNA polymerase III delta prime subunit